jgi:hypothetical protein
MYKTKKLVSITLGALGLALAMPAFSAFAQDDHVFVAPPARGGVVVIHEHDQDRGRDYHRGSALDLNRDGRVSRFEVRRAEELRLEQLRRDRAVARARAQERYVARARAENRRADYDAHARFR